MPTDTNALTPIRLTWHADSRTVRAHRGASIFAEVGMSGAGIKQIDLARWGEILTAVLGHEPSDTPAEVEARSDQVRTLLAAAVAQWRTGWHEGYSRGMRQGHAEIAFITLPACRALRKEVARRFRCEAPAFADPWLAGVREAQFSRKRQAVFVYPGCATREVQMEMLETAREAGADPREHGALPALLIAPNLSYQTDCFAIDQDAWGELIGACPDRAAIETIAAELAGEETAGARLGRAQMETAIATAKL